MSTEVLAVIGTTVAAIIAAYSAIYTASQGRKAQVITTEKAAEMSEREAQRAVQMRMLELLGAEVETLNKRIVDLRTRLESAENTVDAERAKRREVELKLDELVDSVDRLRNILGRLPEVKDAPEVQSLLDRLGPPA